MEIQEVVEDNGTSEQSHLNDGCTFRIEDVRSLQPREVKFCRLCALPRACPVAIFDTQGVKMNIAKKINMHLRILVTENSKLPLHVCWDCIKQLNASIKFVSQCVHAQVKIERMYKESVLRKRVPKRIKIDGNESNVNAEECRSISRPISIQLISKEITSNDKTIFKESSDLNEIIMVDASGLQKNNEEMRKRHSSLPNQIKPNGNKNISDKTLQEIPVLEISDSESKSEAADNIRENTADISTASEPNSNTISSGNALKSKVNVCTTDKPELANSIHKKKNQPNHFCQYCEESFTWKADLFKHQESAHQALVHRCSHCGKVFYESTEELIKHENAHQLPSKRQRASQLQKRRIYIKKKALSSNQMPYSNVSDIPGKHRGFVKDSLMPDADWEIMNDEKSGSELLTSTFKDLEILGNAYVSSESFLNKNKDSTGEDSQEIMLGKRTKNEMKSGIVPKVLAGSERSSPQGRSENSSVRSYYLKKMFPCKQCKIQFQTVQQRAQHRRENHVIRYPCRFCPRTFHNRKDFDRHESYHLSTKKHNCRKCSESFETVIELRKHRLDVHLGTPKYKCKTCHKSYHEEHKYFRHMQSHSSDNCYLCEMCGKSFKNRCLLSAHCRMHCMKPVEKKLSCEYCGRLFYIRARLRDHLRVHTGEKPYLCATCGKTFHDNHSLKKHMVSHSLAKQACSFCGLLFKRRENVVLHMKQHSTCNICNLDYSENVKAHLLHRKEFHSAVVEEELLKGFGGQELVEYAGGGGKKGDFSETVTRCQTCGRMFASSFWMQLHQSNHCKKRPIFRCPVCDKIMRHPESYRKHLMMHSDDKTFQCNRCPRKFDIYKNLLKHEKEHKNLKLYSCPECWKTFASSDGLQRHLVAHSTGRIFSCNVCDKTFTRQISLMVHKNQHHATFKQAYRCSVCSLTFSQKRFAQMHEQSHVLEQKLSSENANSLNKDYNLNLGEECFVVDDCLDNVSNEVLVYDTHSIESTYSEIIIVSDKINDD